MLLIPVALFATIAGSLLAPFYSLGLNSVWPFLCCLLTCCCWRWRTAGRCVFLFVFLFFFLLANLRYPLQFPDDSVVARIDQEGSTLAVTAELVNVVQRADERTQLDLKVLRLLQKDKPLSWQSNFMIRIYLGERVTDLLPGDELSFATRLRKPRLYGTPGEFHWPRYLASQGIALTGWLKSAEQISVVGSGPFSPQRQIAAWKGRAAMAIDRAVAEQPAQLVRALVLGEARLLPDALRDKLAQAGISHLFAISGLHMGLLGMFGYRILLCFYRRSSTLLLWQPPQRVLPLLLLPLLFVYLILTGDAVSTRRAFCVAALAAGFWFWRYSVNPLRLLMTLALLFLLYGPLLLWQPGWQLSFAGATGILLWRPLWQERTASLPRWLRRPVSLLLVTVAATLATLPFILASFHLFAPVGLVANLLAVPVVALLALPLGLCGLLFIGLPPLSDLCFAGCGQLLELTVSGVDWFLLLPGLSAQFWFLSRWQYLAIGLGLLPLILLFQPVMWPGWRRFTGFCLGLSLLCGFTTILNTTTQSLIMFSVGQGESMLLTGGTGQTLLVDGGGLYSERFDVGERLLAPALGELGVHRLSAVLLTHDHPDHRKGLLYVLRQFPVGEFWTGVPFADLGPQLQAVLLEKSIPVRLFRAGWTGVDLLDHSAMQVYKNPGGENKNNSSLVVYLQTQAGGLLLTGDLEKDGVDSLLAAGLPGSVSLLKLPHHGSRHSGTERMLDLLQPQLSLVSAGFKNRYGFPARQLVAQLRRQSIPLHRTDLMGTIRVQNMSGQWRVDYWQNGLFH